MLLVVPPTRRWEVGSLFIKLHWRSPWPLGLQIGSWLFTLAGLISCMRCVHQNCKHGTVGTCGEFVNLVNCQLSPSEVLIGVGFVYVYL
jgi:hypothetical protein